MKYSLQWIIKHKGTFDFEEEITFPSEMFEKYAHINGLKDVIVSGIAGSGSTLAAAEREGYAWESRTLSLSDKGQAILTKKHVDDTIDPF